MNGILVSLLSFIVAISVIVTIHEFGHYIVARLLGVKVLRFSVGFGRTLFKYISPRSGIEYVVAALPLGGYVKMLDEREEPVAAHDQPRAFNNKSVYARFAIVAAGPLFNFIFAIFAYASMYMIGVQGLAPEIAKVEPNSIAYQAGLLPGDVLVRINDRQVATWEDAALNLIGEGIKTGVVALQKKTPAGDLEQHNLDLSDTRLLLAEGDPLTKIGITPWRLQLAAKLGEFARGSAAQAQGFLAGDLILQADGVAVKDWLHWVELVKNHPNKEMNVVILRQQQRLVMTLTPKAVQQGNDTIGRIGVKPWIDREAIEARQIVTQENFFEAFSRGWSKTLDMSVLTVKLLGKLITGEASTKNISGPISIAEFAGISAQMGIAAFLSTLAIISISIGILNLLPVPMLDGGHLMYYLVEMVKGSQVSETIQLQGQKIGIMLLAGLMLLAFYNDIQRLFS